MYVVNMRITKTYAQGEYVFSNKMECQHFLENLNAYELESIVSVEKYNAHSIRNAYYDFFI